MTRAALLAAGSAMLCAGCASGTRYSTHVRLIAPSDPDLAEIMERYYQGVENRRWSFAAALLSPRLAAKLGQGGRERRYAGLDGMDVALQQRDGRTVSARLHAGATTKTERATLLWDGKRWAIDDLR